MKIKLVIFIKSQMTDRLKFIIFNSTYLTVHDSVNCHDTFLKIYNGFLLALYDKYQAFRTSLTENRASSVLSYFCPTGPHNPNYKPKQSNEKDLNNIILFYFQTFYRLFFI